MHVYSANAASSAMLWPGLGSGQPFAESRENEVHIDPGRLGQPVVIHAAVVPGHQHCQRVGLPTLAEAFSASFQAVQWVVLAYLLSITALIVSIGRLGDLLGRRRLLLIGIALFTVASLLCALAPNLWLLIAARALQGVGAATMMALTMALVSGAVPKEKWAARWACSARCRRLAPRSARPLEVF